MTGLLTKLLGISAYTGLVAVTLPYIQQHDVPSRLLASLNTILSPPADDTFVQDTPPEPFVCHAQNYTTQIVSLDPLVIYIRDFLNDADIAGLLEAGEPEFRPSYVVKNGVAQGTPDRTSWSAGLPIENAAVQCVLKRAEGFMGTTLAPGRDEIGPPQLVRYTEGQRFNVHHDWYDAFQPDVRTGRDRRWNRIASFFAILQDECTGGDTWFPKVRAVTPQHLTEEAHWRRHEDGGLAFKPVRGNAVFWVNLHENGTGDERVVHAGLPVGAGLKTAMNIWPRRYLGPEAWAEGEEPREEDAVTGAEGKSREDEEELVVDDAEADPI
ncbi:2OG-Fe(II) oxygenase family oxidoreductase [Colletotrichum tofieldiae]|uniref:2OG-Fe(II) oxygenase family oxidoreductase n=1 Tax=Colletotrichum tofieldiae TaxID=708197 RepID=A0A166S9G7_9PEZI|nr:2OG-Fe(II) oxygenase family oxidoreductase [Colletotrichum tofieldiae]GKT52772.1 2OG-Fe(II) oxygenase family oxidoreductase [Colletotrichum tofieldiae]GKT80827.1 2OG-Fe(II) oxygenase family oxidoreductase [Colletotrichum tofieldiae]